MTTYAFSDVSATLLGPGGKISLGNGAGAADEGITIDYTDDKGSMITGADGDVMHSLHASQSAKITVRLLKTSPTNEKLSVMFNAQKVSSLAWGKNTLVVSDTARGDVVAGTQIAFIRHCPVTYSKDGNTNEWNFQGKVEMLLGAGV